MGEEMQGDGGAVRLLTYCRGRIRGTGKEGGIGLYTSCSLPDPFHIGSNNGLRRRQENGRPQVDFRGDLGGEWNTEVDLKRAGEGTVAPSARPHL